MQLVPAIVSLLVLGAHFLRAGNVALVVLVLVLVLVLHIRRPWAARTVQLALALGAIEWGRTTVRLATGRIDAGEPVFRLVVILGAVTLVTASSALMFGTRRLRAWYGQRGGEVGDGSEP
jgi:hypothetical protein